MTRNGDYENVAGGDWLRRNLGKDADPVRRTVLVLLAAGLFGIALLPFSPGEHGERTAVFSGWLILSALAQARSPRWPLRRPWLYGLCTSLVVAGTTLIGHTLLAAGVSGALVGTLSMILLRHRVRRENEERAGGGLGVKAITGAVIVAVGLIAVASTGTGTKHPTRTTDAHENIWENGQPTSKQLEEASAVVELCLGPAQQIGETVYDYPAFTEHDVRAIAKAEDLVFRVIGRDDHCDTTIGSEPMKPDRLNVFLVDGRVAWAHKF